MTNEECVSVSSEQFLKMRQDSDKVLQKLIKNMIEKESDEGELTIKISVKFIPEYVNQGPGNTARKALKPSYEHKVSSQMKISDSEAGKSFDDMKEVVYDEESGKYITRYIQGSEQMNIFDYERQQQEQEEREKEAAGLPGPTYLLPENAETRSEADNEVIDAEFVDVEEDTTAAEENAGEGNLESELPENKNDSEMRTEENAETTGSEGGEVSFLDDYKDFENYSYDSPEIDPDTDNQERWL